MAHRLAFAKKTILRISRFAALNWSDDWIMRPPRKQAHFCGPVESTIVLTW
jgi:hypothetical protein